MSFSWTSLSREIETRAFPFLQWPVLSLGSGVKKVVLIWHKSFWIDTCLVKKFKKNTKVPVLGEKMDISHPWNTFSTTRDTFCALLPRLFRKFFQQQRTLQGHLVLWFWVNWVDLSSIYTFRTRVESLTPAISKRNGQGKMRWTSTSKIWDSPASSR